MSDINSPRPTCYGDSKVSFSINVARFEGMPMAQAIEELKSEFNASMNAMSNLAWADARLNRLTFLREFSHSDPFADYLVIGIKAEPVKP